MQGKRQNTALVLKLLLLFTIYSQIDNPDLIKHIERVGKEFYS